MSDKKIHIERVLIGHRDAGVRQTIEDALRGMGNGSSPVYHSDTAGELMEKARRLDPAVVFVDLGDSRELALDVARTLRRADRRIIGIYNPLLTAGREGELLRMAARAGVNDFLAAPLSEADVRDALRAVDDSPAPDASGGEGATVSFFSAKGGTGATTLAMHTARAAAEAAGDVALCDLDLQFGSVASMLGLEPEHDLADLVADLDSPGPLQSYFSRDPGSGLCTLPRPADLERAEQVTPEDISRLLILLRQRFRVCVADLPSRIDLLTFSVLDLSETVYVVLDPFYPTLAETRRLLRLLADQGFGRERIRLVVNQVAPFPGAVSIGAIEDDLEEKIFCSVPYEPKIRLGGHTGDPQLGSRGKSPFSKALAQLASDVRTAGVPATKAY